jgi:hypothetical protein
MPYLAFSGLQTPGCISSGGGGKTSHQYSSIIMKGILGGELVRMEAYGPQGTQCA